MKLEEVAIKSSLLLNSRTKSYRESRKVNLIFYYFVESLMNKYRDYVNTIDEEVLKLALEQHGKISNTEKKQGFELKEKYKKGILYYRNLRNVHNQKNE